MIFDFVVFFFDDFFEWICECVLIYDRENIFFQQDFDELCVVGYLLIFVLKECGGVGFGFVEVVILQQCFVEVVFVMVLVVNMYLVWIGVVKVFFDCGVFGLEFVQDGVVVGEVYVFGISEGGNDFVFFGSDIVVVLDGDGGYVFIGIKIFILFVLVWIGFGLYGLDMMSFDVLKFVFVFVEWIDVVVIFDDWDIFGMWGIQSWIMCLNGVVVDVVYVV